MKRKFSMPEYYKLQGILAEKYGIADHHAGCHITHFPESELCTICIRRDRCKEIFEQEKNSYTYVAGMTVDKKEG